MQSYDVLLIGGGIAGTSLGYELAPEMSVGVLDMEGTLGFHTTGRSAAAFLESYGSRTIRMHVAASRQFFEDPPEDFDRPLLRPRSLIWVAPKDEAGVIDRMKASVMEFVDDAQTIDAAEAVERCPVLDPEWFGAGLVEPGASDIDVHALHQGFIRGLRRRGGHTHLTSKVVELDRRSGVWTVTTASGEQFQAPIIVNAAGAWGDQVGVLAGAAPVGLRPLLRNIFIVARPEVREGYEYLDMPLVHEASGRFYFKPEGNGLLCSPADELPSVPCDAKPDEASIAEAIERINEATTMNLRHVRNTWAGLRTFVKDRTPVVCFDPEVEGYFWYVGQGGYGMETSPALARSAAAMLTGQELPADMRERGLVEADLHRDRLTTAADLLATH